MNEALQQKICVKKRVVIGVEYGILGALLEVVCLASGEESLKLLWVSFEIRRSVRTLQMKN